MLANSPNQQLHFLQQKIEQIGSAIFFNQSDSVIKLPTSLVSTVKVDDYGFVWFFVNRPGKKMQEFETEFPARMDFFRKGVDYFLQVSGKGWVVTDPEEVSGFFGHNRGIDSNIMADALLIKVKMLKAEYFETQTRLNTSWWQNAVDFVSGWFRHSSHPGASSYSPAS